MGIFYCPNSRIQEPSVPTANEWLLFVFKFSEEEKAQAKFDWLCEILIGKIG